MNAFRRILTDVKKIPRVMSEMIQVEGYLCVPCYLHVQMIRLETSFGLYKWSRYSYSYICARLMARRRE